MVVVAAVAVHHAVRRPLALALAMPGGAGMRTTRAALSAVVVRLRAVATLSVAARGAPEEAAVVLVVVVVVAVIVVAVVAGVKVVAAMAVVMVGVVVVMVLLPVACPRPQWVQD